MRACRDVCRGGGPAADARLEFWQQHAQAARRCRSATKAAAPLSAAAAARPARLAGGPARGAAACAARGQAAAAEAHHPRAARPVGGQRQPDCVPEHTRLPDCADRGGVGAGRGGGAADPGARQERVDPLLLLAVFARAADPAGAAAGLRLADCPALLRAAAARAGLRKLPGRRADEPRPRGAAGVWPLLLPLPRRRGRHGRV
mmetsp:Transcript_42339/g.136494  ORF Transcript_42339/g.136494 Transcript_42339/m.136494 type:complete len:203 (-) Transcript_42339:740-1348(-)